METGSFQKEVIEEHILEEIRMGSLKQIIDVRTLFMTLLHAQ